MSDPSEHVIAAWLLDQRATLKPSTLGTYGKFARQACRQLDIYTCTRADAQRVVHNTWRTDAGRTVATEVLRRLLRWMEVNGLRDDCPIPAGQHSKGGNGPARLNPPPPWIPPVDAWQRYLLAIGRSEATRHTYRRIIVAFAHAHPDSPTVNGQDLIDYYADHPHWQPATRRNTRKALSDFYRWAENTGVAANPIAALPTMPVPDAIPRPAPDSVYAAALAEAEPADRLMLLLAAHGLRRGEIARAHSDHLTADGLYITGKGGKRRLIPITSELREALAPVHGYAFPSRFDPHRPADPTTIGKHLRKAMHHQASPHQLRHRFGTRAYQATHNIRAVQQLMGHTDPKTTAIYVQIGSVDLRTAVEAAAT